MYSEYFNTGSGLDVIFPETKAYTCPIYLGGSYAPDTQRFSGNSANGGFITVEYTPSAGVSSFAVTGLPTTAIILIATRSGNVKGITNAATTNSMYLQINSNVVTLPTGDVTQAGELFTFTYR